MKQYWQQLKPRERMFIMIGGGFFLILVLYLAVLEPLIIKVDELTVKVDKQKTLVKSLKSMSKEVALLRQNTGGAVISKRQGQSLLVLVDRTSKREKLAKSITRIEPDGTARVRVWLEKAAFDDLIKWLSVLESKYNILVETAVVDKTPVVGRVNVRVVFLEGNV